MRRIALSKFKFTLTLPSEVFPGLAHARARPIVGEKRFRLLYNDGWDTDKSPVWGFFGVPALGANNLKKMSQTEILARLHIQDPSAC